MSITYRYIKGKFILHYKGMHFPVKPTQIPELRKLLDQMEKEL